MNWITNDYHLEKEKVEVQDATSAKELRLGDEVLREVENPGGCGKESGDLMVLNDCGWKGGRCFDCEADAIQLCGKTSSRGRRTKLPGTDLMKTLYKAAASSKHLIGHLAVPNGFITNVFAWSFLGEKVRMRASILALEADRQDYRTMVLSTNDQIVRGGIKIRLPKGSTEISCGLRPHEHLGIVYPLLSDRNCSCQLQTLAS